MTTTRKTAAETYQQKAETTRDLLKRIASRLAEHELKQAGEPRSWGYVGDLDHINEELAQVLASLGDRSAVEELGLVS